MTFLSLYKDGRLQLRLFVQPKSSRNAFCGLRGESIRLAVTAPPVDGKANKAVVTFLASFFGVKKNDITVKHGLQSRTKSILLAGTDLHTARERLKKYL